MDNILKTVRTHFDHDAAKQILKEKYEAKMLFAAFNGMWKAGPELIMSLFSVDGKEIVLTDEYGNPCKVNRHELMASAKERWQEQMNAWYDEFNETQKKR